MSATVDSHARPDYPLVRENPTEAKSLRYNGSLECGLFYAEFRTLARYYGWRDNDSLLVPNVSVESPALKYFHIKFSVLNALLTIFFKKTNIFFSEHCGR